MSDLPESWAECAAGEIAQIVGGSTPPSKDAANFSTTEGVPWITPADLSGHRDMYISRGARNLTEEGLAACSARLIPAGSVLFSSRAPIGYVAIARNPVTTNQGFKSFVLPPEMNSRFVYYYLRHIKSVAEAYATGTTFKELSGAATARLPVLIAPANEQTHIADKLDALLSQLDACRDHLNSIPGILKRLHQSILAAAVNGRLTSDWRRKRGRARQWEHTTIGAVLEAKPRNGYSPRSVDRPTPVKSLTLTATTTGTFRPEHFKYLDETIPSDSHLWLEPGDVLVQRANTIEYVGVSAVFDGPKRTFIYPDLMMKCRAGPQILTTYLYYALSSEPVRKFFRDRATGTAGNMPKINQQTVISAPIRLPPVEEQAEIVRRARALLNVAESLEQKLERARARTAQIGPSVLAMAFRGKLVPQNPSDEPASELIRGVRSEQANLVASRVLALVGR